MMCLSRGALIALALTAAPTAAQVTYGLKVQRRLEEALLQSAAGAAPGRHVRCGGGGKAYRCASQHDARLQCQSVGMSLCKAGEINSTIGQTCAFMWTASSVSRGYYVSNGTRKCGQFGFLISSDRSSKGVGLFDAACCQDLSPSRANYGRYLRTFAKTGCPNPTVNWSRWETQTDEEVWSDMYTVCNHTASGDGSREEIELCCGSHNTTCNPDCVNQSSWVRSDLPMP